MASRVCQGVFCTCTFYFQWTTDSSIVILKRCCKPQVFILNWIFFARNLDTHSAAFFIPSTHCAYLVIQLYEWRWRWCWARSWGWCWWECRRRRGCEVLWFYLLLSPVLHLDRIKWRHVFKVDLQYLHCLCLFSTAIYRVVALVKCAWSNLRCRRWGSFNSTHSHWHSDH